MSLLAIEGLTVKFGGLVAVNDLSLAVEQGSIHGLIGPNGAGKSTVFNCISRFYRPSAGTMRFDGRDLIGCEPHQIIGLGIARTFQNVELFRRLTVLDNLLVGLHSRTGGGVVSGAFFLPKVRQEERQARARAMEVLNFLGIGHLANQLAAGLPYGQQKLVELGRALVSRPKLVLLDEPAAGMNSQETAELGGLIRQIREFFGVTVLLVEHDMSLVMSLCERITVVNFGGKIAEGTPAEIQRNQAVIKAYLGEEAGSEEVYPKNPRREVRPGKETLNA